MSRITALLVLVVLAAVLTASAGVVSGGRAGLSYATSASMEPVIRSGDGFLIWPSRKVAPGDIVVFRPVRLEAERVVHRVVAVTPEGYVTRGDNTLQADQAAGEPLVAPERVLGKVVVTGSGPVTIPGLAAAGNRVRALLGQYTRPVLLLILIVSAGSYAWESLSRARKRSASARVRVGHLYWASCGFAIFAVTLATSLSSGVQEFRYLSSVNPGEIPFHVQAGAGGSVTVKVANRGLVPVYHFSRGVGETRVESAPEMLLPRTEADLRLWTPPREPGWYRIHVHAYHYPVLLPRAVLAALHNRSPLLAMLVNAVVIGAPLAWAAQWLALWVPLTARQRSRPGAHIHRLMRHALRGRRIL